MTNHPNYRRVECCGNCRHYAFGEAFMSRYTWCSKVSQVGLAMIAAMQENLHLPEDHICDDYEAEDGE